MTYNDRLAEYDAKLTQVQESIDAMKPLIRWRAFVAAAMWYTMPFLGMWAAGTPAELAARWAFLPCLLMGASVWAATSLLLLIQWAAYVVLPSVEPLREVKP